MPKDLIVSNQVSDRSGNLARLRVAGLGNGLAGCGGFFHRGGLLLSGVDRRLDSPGAGNLGSVLAISLFAAGGRVRASDHAGAGGGGITPGAAIGAAARAAIVAGGASVGGSLDFAILGVSVATCLVGCDEAGDFFGTRPVPTSCQRRRLSFSDSGEAAT